MSPMMNVSGADRRTASVWSPVAEATAPAVVSINTGMVVVPVNRSGSPILNHLGLRRIGNIAKHIAMADGNDRS